MGENQKGKHGERKQEGRKEAREKIREEGKLKPYSKFEYLTVLSFAWCGSCEIEGHLFAFIFSLVFLPSFTTHFICCFTFICVKVFVLFCRHTFLSPLKGEEIFELIIIHSLITLCNYIG